MSSPGPRYCSWAPESLLRNPAVRRMGAEAFGGYASLLVEIWLDPSGSVPNDDEELALLSRLGSRGWLKHSATLRSLLYEEGDRLRSDIVDEALARVRMKSEAGKVAVEAREKRKAVENYRKLEPKPESNDDRPPKRKVTKEKEKEKVIDTPPPPPSGSGKAVSKALKKGNPENEASWLLFDDVYPRPGNGRKLEVAAARLTWDELVEDGEDMTKIVEGATRYREWIYVLKKREYVAMMTTWLNQRRWLESYEIDPESEDGQRLRAEREAVLREERSAHMAKFTPAYEAWLDERATEGANDPLFVANWRASVEAAIERWAKIGFASAESAQRALLEDEARGLTDRKKVWRESAILPDFWAWCSEVGGDAAFGGGDS